MRLLRRRFMHLTVSVVALPALPRVARAQAYPSRPVHLIVGFAAGGPNDISARLMGQWLSERFSRPFIVENRPGAATNLATELVVRAPADCYTLLLVGASAAITRRSMTISASISSATSLRSRASCVHLLSWWSTRRFRLKRFPTSSSMRKLIRLRSTWRRPATAACHM